jgi:hypothetical protein
MMLGGDGMPMLANRRIRRLILLLGVLLLCWLAYIGVSGFWQDDVDDPRTYEGWKATVHLEDAFEDHQLEVPSPVERLQYGARNDLEGYPMSADFWMPCEAAWRYFEENGFSVHGDILPTVRFHARRIGDSIPVEMHYYLREGNHDLRRVEAMMTPERDADCHVYLKS